MKVCPIQKYGMKSVMEHYVSTGQVLGKGTHELEGYALEGKDYFGPGELPTFDSEFFHMPMGTADEHVLAEFKSKYSQMKDQNSPEGQALFEEFKGKLLSALSLNPDVEEDDNADYI